MSPREQGPRELGRRAVVALRCFYREPVSWLALALTSALLAYAGGAVMFWFHALYRGEQGPAISPWFHWLLDASLGFIGLTPALFFILPLVMAVLHKREAAGRIPAWHYVGLVGAVFAVVTGPGPFLHDLIAGRGTWLARSAQTLFGVDWSVAHRPEVVHSLLSESLWQVGLGIPVYVALACLGLAFIRLLAARLAIGPERRARQLPTGTETLRAVA